MHRKIAIASVEPRRLAQLSHGLQAEKSISFHTPAPLAAEQAGENVGDRVDIRGDIKPPPAQVVASVDDHRDLFRRNDLAQTIHKLGSASPSGKHTDHAALFSVSLARPSLLRAARSFSVNNSGREASSSSGKNSG